MFARTLLFVAAALSLVLVVDVGPARADTGELSIDLGATRIASDGDARWQPTVRGEFVFDLIGPLQAGLYGQLIGTELPLQDPGIGGGLVIAVRPMIPLTRLRPMVEIAGGRQRLRVPQTAEARVWVTSATLGLGVVASPILTVEGRVSHTWLHGLENPSLGDRTWAATLGLRFSIP